MLSSRIFEEIDSPTLIEQIEQTVDVTKASINNVSSKFSTLPQHFFGLFSTRTQAYATQVLPYVSLYMLGMAITGVAANDCDNIQRMLRDIRWSEEWYRHDDHSALAGWINQLGICQLSPSSAAPLQCHRITEILHTMRWSGDGRYDDDETMARFLSNAGLCQEEIGNHYSSLRTPAQIAAAEKAQEMAAETARMAAEAAKMAKELSEKQRQEFIAAGQAWLDQLYKSYPSLPQISFTTALAIKDTTFIIGIIMTACVLFYKCVTMDENNKDSKETSSHKRNKK